MKILFIDTLHSSLIQSLRKEGHECIEGYHLTKEQVIQSLPGIGGLVIRSRFVLDKNFLEHGRELKFIARAGAGMENIDVSYAENRGIICINSPEGNRDAVGEHATGMLLSLLNNLHRADREVRQGKWNRESNRGRELGLKNVGIIGYGNMGSAFAGKLRGFGCKIIAYDKYKTGFGNEWVSEATMQELFEQADIVSLHVPLTAETEYMVDAKFLNRFTKPVIIINTARGKCLRTTDLAEAIQNGKVSGACLDVIEFEDHSFEKFNPAKLTGEDSWNYLIRSDRVVFSPHIAGWTHESNEKIAQALYNKIRSITRS